MKSEEPPVIPPYDSDENLLQDDNVDEQENESDEEEVSLGDFDEQGKMTVDSRKSHDLILFLNNNFEHIPQVGELHDNLPVCQSAIRNNYVCTFVI